MIGGDMQYYSHTTKPIPEKELIAAIWEYIHNNAFQGAASDKEVDSIPFILMLRALSQERISDSETTSWGLDASLAEFMQKKVDSKPNNGLKITTAGYTESIKVEKVT